MIFASLVASFLLATALAAPSHIGSRVPHRKSSPRIKAIAPSSNWGGIVLTDYPPGTFVAVTGTIVVPTLSAPDGSLSAWVGIDGVTCNSAILQTGIDMAYENGDASYDAWYEWYPNYAYDFSGISVSAGDSIQLTINVYTSTSGSATIDNLTTGQSATQNLTSSSALCQENAEWVVEDYQSGGLCDFGDIQFTDAYATTASGTRVYPPSGSPVIIEQNGQVLTSVSTGSESVSVSYQ
ncbi:hypothetical protein AX14_003887 [Amanita brunnescens Koide BX004]|nr:hypothetical protein AX14_003887 [Amanita brunnescens Koide BX004]